MRVLLTNDDGIDAEGLQALRRALLGVDGVDLQVIAPDGDRSAIGRGITVRRALGVERRTFEDGTHGYATDGTPVDCVRLGMLGLVEGWAPDLVVSGINHGSNLGDDITYSGTVAAALEGLLLGLPAIASSQQSEGRDMGWDPHSTYDFSRCAAFVARLVQELETVPLPESTMLNVNAPGGVPEGVEVCRLGKRIYRDELRPADEEGKWVMYGASPGFEDVPGTDLAAVHAGRVAVTPLHLDLTFHDGIGDLSMAQLDRMLEPAAREVS